MADLNQKKEPSKNGRLRKFTGRRQTKLYVYRLFIQSKLDEPKLAN